MQMSTVCSNSPRRVPKCANLTPSDSQLGILESCCPSSWPTRHGKNLPLPRPSSKTFDPTFSPVRLDDAVFLNSLLMLYGSYSQARLLEINSHSLFSKWFSESGKLVQRLFSSITELVEEEDAFLVVLIGIYAFVFCLRF
jgi:hypothetical protein